MTAVATANVGGYATVSSDGSWSIDGAVAKAVDALDAAAPAFVKKLESAALQSVATYETVITTLSEAAGEAAALGVDSAALAALSGAFPVVGIAIGVIIAALEIWGASSGPGCCGTSPLTQAQAAALLTNPFTKQAPSPAAVTKLIRYGSCDPTQYAWPQAVGNYTAPTAPGELFVSNFIRGLFENGNDCWSRWSVGPPDLSAQLTLAAAVWNRTHSSVRKTVVRRMVNVPTPYTFGNSTTMQIASASNEPIAVALQQAATHLGVGSAMSFTLNTGPAVSAAIGATAAKSSATIAGTKPVNFAVSSGNVSHLAATTKVGAGVKSAAPTTASTGSVVALAAGAGLAAFLFLRR